MTRRKLTLSMVVLVAMIAALVVAAPGASAQSSPPARVSEITITRDDGTLTATWPAATSATHYHITHTTNNAQSWNLSAFDHTTNTITINADNTKTYIIAVRAYNDTGTSSWTNSQPAQPHTAPIPAPSPVSEITITRDDGALTATWPAATNATHYHITHTTNNAQSWNLAKLDHPDTTITINNIHNDKAYIIAVRAYNDTGTSSWTNSQPANPYTAPIPAPSPVSEITITRDDGALTATWPAATNATHYHITYTDNNAQSWNLAKLDHPDTTITINNIHNDKAYIVGVRARNTTGASNWTNSQPAQAFVPKVPPARPTGLSATAGDGSVTLDWDDPSNSTVTGYEYAVRAAPPSPGWSPWTPIENSGASTTTHTLDRLANGIEYRFKIRAVNPYGISSPAPLSAPWYVSATPLASPTVDDVTPTSATLTLDSYSGQWYYQKQTGGTNDAGGSSVAGDAKMIGAASVAGQSGCNGPVNGARTTINGLDPDTNYTYGVFGNAQCTEVIAASAVIATLPPAPGQPAKPTVAPEDQSIDVSWAPPTGTSTSYQLQYRPCQVTSASRSTPCRTRAALGSPWVPAWAPWGTTGTWLHGNSGWVHTTSIPKTITGLTNGVRYQVRVRASNNTPNGTSHGPWSAPSDDVWPNPQIQLSVTNVTGAKATLTLTLSRVPVDSVTWYYKANTGPHSSCSSGQTRASTTVTGLTEHTQYTYTAYSDSACTAANEIAAATFSPDDDELAVSAITETTATLTLANHTGNWYYKANTGPHVTCLGPNSTTTAALTGLTAGTSHTYSAYNDAACATQIGRHSAEFTTLGLAASLITDTTATLTIAGHSGNWYVKKTSPSPEGSCSSAISTTTHSLTGLSPATTYTYKAYSDSACTTANLLATSSFKTFATLTASSVSTTAATLTISAHSGNWYVRQASATTCSSAISGTTHSLSSLNAGTSYLYYAFSDSACSTLIAFERFSTAETVSNLSETWAGAALTVGVDNLGIRSVYAQPFTTGSATSGYTLTSASVDHDIPANFGTLSALDVTLHAGLGTDVGPPLAALGSISTGASAGVSTVNCSNGCELRPSTTYALVFSASASGDFPNEGHWLRALVNNGGNETATPAGNGWSIADRAWEAGRVEAEWSALNNHTLRVSVTAVPNRHLLSASGITGTGATLTLTGHAGDWWLKQTAPSAGACTAGEADLSHALSTLTAGATYTYKAYNGPACTAANELASASFTTVGLTAIDITPTTANLKLIRHIPYWYSKRTAPTTLACSDAVQSAGYTLTTLTAGTTYTYKAYSDSTCSTEIGSATFTTPASLTPGSVTSTTATLAIAGHSGNWYLKQTAPTTGTCSSAITGTTHNLSTLTAGTTYTYKAYSDSNCTTANELATATFTTPASLTASSVTSTTATLTIAGHSGDWYLKRTSPTAGTCTPAISTTTLDLSTLTAGTTYTYKAYSDSNCSTENELATATFTTATS